MNVSRWTCRVRNDKASGLIKNKKLLSDLIGKEKGYQNVENTSDNESNNEESSSD